MRYGEAFERLVAIMDRLRSPGGCPWDREQTLATLRPYLLEEAYEVLEALETDTPREHCEELGDLMLQIVFQSRIRQEDGHFTVADVCDAISDKLERRHPHVFGDAVAEDAAAVVRNWSDIKAQERAGKATKDPSALDGVPAALPALQRAARIGDKAAAAGFDWREPKGVLEKLDEETRELKAALEAQDAQGIADEMGDFLFTVVNLCRHLGVDAEAALRGTTGRFERRFREMERTIAAEGQTIRALPDAELEARWQAAKKRLAGAAS